jgi:hypothetical protein
MSVIWMDVDAALSEVPVNVCPLTDDTDFKTIEAAVAYNATGLALYWHFVTTGGAETTTQVTPTTGGTYDWAHAGQGMYTIEMPASGGASINNDTEGFGYFTGVATGVLPWRGPTIGFRAAALNDLLIDAAFSATRGLSGTALPDAAAGANGGLPILSSSASRLAYTISTVDRLGQDPEYRLLPAELQRHRDQRHGRCGPRLERGSESRRPRRFDTNLHCRRRRHICR